MNFERHGFYYHINDTLKLNRLENHKDSYALTFNNEIFFVLHEDILYYKLKNDIVIFLNYVLGKIHNFYSLVEAYVSGNVLDYTHLKRI